MTYECTPCIVRCLYCSHSAWACTLSCSTCSKEEEVRAGLGAEWGNSAVLAPAEVSQLNVCSSTSLLLFPLLLLLPTNLPPSRHHAPRIQTRFAGLSYALFISLFPSYGIDYRAQLPVRVDRNLATTKAIKTIHHVWCSGD